MKILKRIGIGLLGLVLSVVGVTLLLNFAYPDMTNMPVHYIVDRPLHDDWPPGLKWIPRAWTYFPEIPMPPRKWAGTQEEDCIRIQPMYPLAADTEFCPDGRMVGIHPVGPVGTWSIQSAYIADRRIPCFFTASLEINGYRVHLNTGLKPDITVQDDKIGDSHWAFPELSFTLKKL